MTLYWIIIVDADTNAKKMSFYRNIRVYFNGTHPFHMNRAFKLVHPEEYLTIGRET